MTADDLYEAVEVDDKLSGDAIYFDEDTQECTFVVRNKISGQLFMLKTSDFKDRTWDQIGPVLRLESSGQNLVTYSRVCGYYSRVNNWNASKKAERGDRLKGDYCV